MEHTKRPPPVHHELPDHNWICSYTLRGESPHFIQTHRLYAHSTKEACDTFWRTVEFAGCSPDMITSLSVQPL